MRKVLLGIVIIITLAAAGGGWVLWQVWSPRRTSPPVVILQVNSTTDLKVLQGNPLVFTAYLSGSTSAPGLRIGSPGHPWHSYLKLESTDTKQQLPWKPLLLSPPQSLSLGPDTSEHLTPEKGGGDEAMVSSHRLYVTELGAAPEEAARVPEGRYTAS